MKLKSMWRILDRKVVVSVLKLMRAAAQATSFNFFQAARVPCPKCQGRKVRFEFMAMF